MYKRHEWQQNFKYSGNLQLCLDTPILQKNDLSFLHPISYFTGSAFGFIAVAVVVGNVVVVVVVGSVVVVVGISVVVGACVVVFLFGVFVRFGCILTVDRSVVLDCVVVVCSGISLVAGFEVFLTDGSVVIVALNGVTSFSGTESVGNLWSGVLISSSGFTTPTGFLENMKVLSTWVRRCTGNSFLGIVSLRGFFLCWGDASSWRFFAVCFRGLLSVFSWCFFATCLVGVFSSGISSVIVSRFLKSLPPWCFFASFFCRTSSPWWCRCLCFSCWFFSTLFSGVFSKILPSPSSSSWLSTVMSISLLSWSVSISSPDEDSVGISVSFSACRISFCWCWLRSCWNRLYFLCFPGWFPAMVEQS